MITLNFIVNKDFILQHALKSYSSSPLFWKLKKKVWSLDKDLYFMLSQNLEPLIFDSNLVSGIKNTAATLEGNLAQIYETKEFKKILSDTKKCAASVEKQWNKNYKESSAYLEAITKINLENIDKKIDVYVSNPLLTKGRTYAENGTIAWAHSEDWKNYSTVYLWHEVMHHLTFDKKCNQHLMHALIELTCDNELRIRLNKNGKYFNENGYAIGHKCMVDSEKKLLPDWKLYLKNKNENLFSFEKRIRSKFKNDKVLKQLSGLAWWAEWH